MFFAISSTQDNRLPCHSQIGNYWFSHDNGWQQLENCWYKGYFHPEINHGNFLKISFEPNGCVDIEHDLVRGFPVWWDPEKKVLTNFLGTGQQIWADKKISLVNHDICTQPAASYDYDLSYDLTIDTAADLVCENLIKKAEALKNWSPEIPKKLFLTGGVDTTVLYSVLKYVGVAVEILDYEYIKYDWFLNHNWTQLKAQHWGYGQIHHWTDPTILVTGGCGDEYLFRGPNTIGMWSAWHSIDIIKQLVPGSYHTDYFLKEKNISVFQQHWRNKDALKSQFPRTKDIAKQIVNLNYNDYQHWHLGNTLTWTPFKDIDLLKISLRLDVDSTIDHIVNASLNKKIIKKLCPNALALLSNTKNFNGRQNLTKKQD
jgi:hypothetical protein